MTTAIVIEAEEHPWGDDDLMTLTRFNPMLVYGVTSLESAIVRWETQAHAEIGMRLNKRGAVCVLEEIQVVNDEAYGAYRVTPIWRTT